MKITFCLPQPGNSPIGGYKIVYEYANRLSRLGNKVCIVYDCGRLFYKDRFIVLRYLKTKIKYNRNKHWFILDKKVRIKYAFKGIREDYFPKADCVIATAVETVREVCLLPSDKGSKFYFVQDIENWSCSDEYLNSTYALPCAKIAISDWIKHRVDKYSREPAVVIPNGIDFTGLSVKIPIEKRNPHTVSMLYHSMPHKGCKYGIDALLMLKKTVPDLKAEMFGVPPRPDNLPSWIHYTQNAGSEELLNIYNKTALFLCPTINEGFGLTGAESMACGCALVSTDYGGVKMYARNNENSLLCKPENSRELYLSMLKVMNDNNLRIRLASAGCKDIKKLNWDNSVKMFENTLNKYR